MCAIGSVPVVQGRRGRAEQRAPRGHLDIPVFALFDRVVQPAGAAPFRELFANALELGGALSGVVSPCPQSSVHSIPCGLVGAVDHNGSYLRFLASSYPGLPVGRARTSPSRLCGSATLACTSDRTAHDGPPRVLGMRVSNLNTLEWLGRVARHVS